MKMIPHETMGSQCYPNIKFADSQIVMRDLKILFISKQEIVCQCLRGYQIVFSFHVFFFDKVHIRIRIQKMKTDKFI